MKSNPNELDCLNCPLPTCNQHDPRCLVYGQDVAKAAGAPVPDDPHAGRRKYVVCRSDTNAGWLRQHISWVGGRIAIMADDPAEFQNHDVPHKPHRMGRRWRVQLGVAASADLARQLGIHKLVRPTRAQSTLPEPVQQTPAADSTADLCLALAHAETLAEITSIMNANGLGRLGCLEAHTLVKLCRWAVRRDPNELKLAAGSLAVLMSFPEAGPAPASGGVV